MTLEQLHAIALEQAQHMDNLYLRNVPAVVLQEFATRFLAAIEPALQQEDRTPRYCSEHPAVCAAPTKAEALEALDALDDFARMESSVDPFGPRKVLEEFIREKGK